MYKIIKHPWETRNNLYWSSDFHAFHDPIHWTIPLWESRGYRNAHEAAEHKIQRINERVPEDGILYFLGDGFLNATDEQCKNWLSRINCKNIKYLWGNHESNMFRIYKQEILSQFGRDDIEVYPLKVGNVEFLGNHLEILVGKKRIIMNHFPLRIWHKNGHGSWMLSGHSHLTDKGRHPDHPTSKGVDVGWDWKKDVWTFDELNDIMSTKDTEILDHHNSQTT